MKKFYIIAVGVITLLSDATAASKTTYISAPAVERFSTGIADTNSRSNDKYALSAENKSTGKENSLVSDTKTGKTRSTTNIVDAKATDRNKLVKSSKLKVKKSNKALLLKMKAETHKTRKQQERFVKKRTNANANRYYKHHSLKGIF